MCVHPQITRDFHALFASQRRIAQSPNEGPLGEPPPMPEAQHLSSNNLEQIGGNLEHIGGNFEHIGGNFEHISGNYEHIGGNYERPPSRQTGRRYC